MTRQQHKVLRALSGGFELALMPGKPPLLIYPGVQGFAVCYRTIASLVDRNLLTLKPRNQEDWVTFQLTKRGKKALCGVR